MVTPSPSSRHSALAPDLLLYHASVHTLNPAQPTAEAVAGASRAVLAGRVAAVRVASASGR